MVEILNAFGFVITSIINFMFTLDFGDGTTVGGFIIGFCVMSLLIRFFFRQLQAGPSTITSAIEYKKELDRARDDYYRRGDY